MKAIILYESGETMVFQGVNIRDPHKLVEEGNWKLSHFKEAKAWGANVIRLPIHPPSWRTRGEEGYLVLIDQALEWARELGLYLILDWHSIGNLKMELFQHEMYITSIEETTAFWDTVSKGYADEPVLLMYELYNEPTISGDNFGDMSWEEWKGINEEIIRVIRSNHPYPEKRQAPWEEKWEADWDYIPTRQGTFFKKVMSSN